MTGSRTTRDRVPRRTAHTDPDAPRGRTTPHATIHVVLSPQVIVFSFAKRECENNAMQLAKLDLTDDDEKVRSWLKSHRSRRAGLVCRGVT